MKKEKTIRTYQRRTKTGKVVTVKQHTAKYDAAEALKEAAKKKGAGDELENLKKKVKPEKVKVEKPAEDAPDYGFTADEYKAWYHWDQDSDPKNKAALKVAKALRAQMGRAGYNKYFNEMTDKYSPRGHISAYKKLGSGSDAPTKSKGTSVSSAKSTEGKSWGSAMKEKYPDTTGKNAEIRSLLGVSHSMRLAPSGYTKGAVTTAIKELRKEGSPESIKMAERIEKTMLGKKKTSIPTSKAKKSKTTTSKPSSGRVTLDSAAKESDVKLTRKTKSGPFKGSYGGYDVEVRTTKGGYRVTRFDRAGNSDSIKLTTLRNLGQHLTAKRGKGKTTSHLGEEGEIHTNYTRGKYKRSKSLQSEVIEDWL